MSYKTNNNADPSGTAFYNHVIIATTDQLIPVLGEPVVDAGDDKSTVEWVVVGPDGEIVTVYDWKEGLDMSKATNIEIAWRIGARRPIHSMNFRSWLESQLKTNESV